jgi:hypothetical protein
MSLNDLTHIMYKVQLVFSIPSQKLNQNNMLNVLYCVHVCCASLGLS